MKESKLCIVPADFEYYSSQSPCLNEILPKNLDPIQSANESKSQPLPNSPQKTISHVHNHLKSQETASKEFHIYIRK